MAARIGIASVFQQIMLDQEEFSHVNLSRKVIATECADLVCAYLRATPTK
jgi:hypothetical protein